MEFLKSKKCVLTKGIPAFNLNSPEAAAKKLQRPHEVHFNLPQLQSTFKNLPYLEDTWSKALSHKFLKELGVRSSPDVKVVFNNIKKVSNSPLKFLIL